MKRKFCFLSLLILLLSSVPLFAKGPPEPLLTNTVVDLSADPATISIFGEKFGLNPEVFMGTNAGTLDPLAVDFGTNTDVFIEAELLTTDPGTYLLVVSNGIGSFMSAMDVTISSRASVI